MSVHKKIAENVTGHSPHVSLPVTLRSGIVPVSWFALGVTAIMVCLQFGMNLWLTSDQQGRWHFHRGQFAEAAMVFRDPMWQGAAWYRAGEFEKAAQAFARRNTAEGLYNQGNAWFMKGEYSQAIGCYDRALVQLPDWPDALENKELATARAAMFAQSGGDMGDQKMGADKIVFDKKAKNEGQDTKVDGAAAVSDQDIQAMWLRRVQTRPADFLKAKFAYQQAMQQGKQE